MVLTLRRPSPFLREERYNHLQRVGFVASELARAGAAVIAAPIAPHEAGRQAVREAVTHQAGPGSNFFLIHVATPVEYCEKTDRRGVYAQAREKGQALKGLSGVDDDFEVPKDANLTVDLTEHSIPQVVHSTFLILSFTMPLSMIIPRRRHRIVTREPRVFYSYGRMQDPDGQRFEEWNGASSHRAGHIMRMAVQLSYGVVYVCELAVVVPTVPIVPVGLTNRPFVGLFLHDVSTFFSNLPNPMDDDDQARKR